MSGGGGRGGGRGGGGGAGGGVGSGSGDAEEFIRRYLSRGSILLMACLTCVVELRRRALPCTARRRRTSRPTSWKASATPPASSTQAEHSSALLPTSTSGTFLGFFTSSRRLRSGATSWKLPAVRDVVDEDEAVAPAHVALPLLHVVLVGGHAPR
ncbi:hypothetical protein CRUP_016309 [Coryphaenoides rupestris]|nr:hypothetical protein CRUP_016309 [Coryphaenoides rupestris]